jgi:hypothetical protein
VRNTLRRWCTIDTRATRIITAAFAYSGIDRGRCWPFSLLRPLIQPMPMVYNFLYLDSPVNRYVRGFHVLWKRVTLWADFLANRMAGQLEPTWQMRGKSIFYRLTLIFCKSDKSTNFFYFSIFHTFSKIKEILHFILYVCLHSQLNFFS